MLPFRDASFDVVLVVTVLCFADDPQRVVNEAFRVLRPDGRVILGELGRWSFWAALRRVRGWLGSAVWRSAHFFAPRALRSLLCGAGFLDVTLRTAIFYPPIHNPRLLGILHRLERHGPRLFPAAGALLAVRGRRPPAVARTNVAGAASPSTPAVISLTGRGRHGSQ